MCVKNLQNSVFISHQPVLVAKVVLPLAWCHLQVLPLDRI